LFLGSSETIGGYNELFNTVHKNKIYGKSVSPPLNLDFVPHFQMEEQEPKTKNHSQRVDLQKVASQILLNRYAPACVVVNDKLEILQLIGQTGKFLDPTPGDASLNLLRMVKAGLKLELRLAFQKARRDGGIRKEGIFVERDGGLNTANFEIVPVKEVPGKERHFLVVFEEGSAPRAKSGKKVAEAPVGKKGGKVNESTTESENERLKDELDATREYLQSIIEEQRTTIEELRSANEGIQSSNEELQSINEELDTAKEELQSTNEELTTVNEELQNRNEELSQLNNDLSNLLASVNLPIIMLGNDLRIRRFTPVTEAVMNLIPGDVGRPITDIKSNLKVQGLRQVVSRVIDSLQTQEVEVDDVNGRKYSMRIRPYRTVDNKIDGVVIVLLDLNRKARPKP
jgi:two-component system CheB/CheR fusion protein